MGTFCFPAGPSLPRPLVCPTWAQLAVWPPTLLKRPYGPDGDHDAVPAVPEGLRRPRTPHSVRFAATPTDVSRPQGQGHGTPHRTLGIPVLRRHPCLDALTTRRDRVEPQPLPPSAARPSRRTLCRLKCQFRKEGCGMQVNDAAVVNLSNKMP